ncbi:MAG: helix-turn-helix domain-containing protein [Oscillospiraceae bacterium]|jgi:DNA-binding XRE family transcriptional regulator
MNKTEINELTVFCENVRLLRKKYGYSKERMAKICGVNKQTLTKIEQMIMPPRLRINVIFIFAGTLDCNRISCFGL